MNNTRRLYTLAWTQFYTEWYNQQETQLELSVKESNLQEAADVLNRIMRM